MVLWLLCWCVVMVLAIIVILIVIVLVIMAGVLSGIGAGMMWKKKKGLVVDLTAFDGYEGEEVLDGCGREFRELALEDIAMVEKIGEGAFGKVYLGKWRGMTAVAVKQLDVQCDARAKAEFIKEANVMARVGNHPNVIHFIGAITTDPEHYYMVLEFAPNGSLQDFVSRQSGSLDDDMLRGMALGAARGVAHLHAEGIVHRDIAARNFLVSQERSVMVSDFGLSRMVEAVTADYATKVTQSNVGPVRWMAPESLVGREYSKQSDTFMFGCFLFELYTGGIPHADLSLPEVIEGVPNGLVPKWPSKTPKYVCDLGTCCWQREPKARPSMAVIVAYLEMEEPNLEEAIKHREKSATKSVGSEPIGLDDTSQQYMGFPRPAAEVYATISSDVTPRMSVQEYSLATHDSDIVMD